jgi:hypothetical protein
MAELPHFSQPFRLEGHSIAVTEQDSNADVADCVELTLRTVQGERRTLPAFGRPDTLVFTTDRDLAQAMIEQAIDDAEPRARAYVEREDDAADEGILRLRAMWGWAHEGGGEIE